MGLMMFRGGPLDGKVFATRDLLHNHNVTLTQQLAEYRWTKEKVQSTRTQAVARVWVHKDLPTGAVDESAQPGKERAMSETTTEAPAFPGAEDTTTEAVTSPDVNVIQPEGEAPVYGDQPAQDVADEQPAEAPKPDAYGELDEEGLPVVQDVDGNSVTIKDYRKRLKLKTSDAIERIAAVHEGKFTGMNLWRLEHGGGKRKVPTVQEVASTLQVLHQEDQAQRAKAAEQPAEQPAETPQDGASPLG